MFKVFLRNLFSVALSIAAFHSRGAPNAPQVLRAFPALLFSEQPVFMTAPAKSVRRLWVVEKTGVISSFPERADVKREEVKVFLDFRPKVYSQDGETGMLGLAFAPDFERSRDFYFSYTRPGRDLVIAKMKATDNSGLSADLGTYREILVVPKVDKNYPNHNGGMLAFGPDGKLYIGTGDGGGREDPRGNSQNLSQLLGKMLRLEVTGQEGYAIPADNPFTKQAGARPEIWAYGLRNPWRFSFDGLTQKLWLGDVGQDRFEEIDTVDRGANLGWNVFEGASVFKNPSQRAASEFQAPRLIYGRTEGVSVTGGYVYRGSQIPSLVGQYLFGDYGSGHVWKLDAAAVKGEKSLVGEVPQLASFAENAQREIYLLSLSGEIWKLE